MIETIIILIFAIWLIRIGREFQRIAEDDGPPTAHQVRVNEIGKN